MGEGGPSAWAIERFGGAADDLVRAVPQAILGAHDHAMGAHLGGELPSNDAYGHTLAQAQHLQLSEWTKGIPGVTRRKPTGLSMRHPLIVINSTNVVLTPYWLIRYKKTDPDNIRVPRPGRWGKLLIELGDEPLDRQLSLFEESDQGLQGTVDEHHDDEVALREVTGCDRIVTIAYGSSPAAGMFWLVWGDAYLDESGYVGWQYREELPLRDQPVGIELPRRTPLSPVENAPAAATVRFDDGVADDDLDLALRPQMDLAPSTGPELPSLETGSDTTR